MTPPPHFSAGWNRLLGRIGLAPAGVTVEALDDPGAPGLAARTVRVFLPPGFVRGRRTPLLVMLDGQSAEGWRLREALADLPAPPVVVTVAATDARLDEYGTAGELDFAGRGRLAGTFQDYLVHELLPGVRARWRLPAEPRRTGIFGASLGGLAALDTAWRHPGVFGFAGVFSGALWWRTDNSSPVAQQASRIMHRRVRETPGRPALRLWFEAGTRDEEADRDGNGVIDAIQDTRELIDELAVKGFRDGVDVAYREVAGGRHDEATWAQVLPEFLRWALSPGRKVGR